MVKFFRGCIKGSVHRFSRQVVMYKCSLEPWK